MKQKMPPNICLCFLLLIIFFLPAVTADEETESSAGVRITEIMYNPVGHDKDYEFLEICNLGMVEINISGYYFQGITFAFPSQTLISSKECLAIAISIDGFQEKYGLYTPYNYSGFLVNSGMKIALIEPFGNTVVHEFTYDDSLAKGNGYSISIFNNTAHETLPNPFEYPYWDNLSLPSGNFTGEPPEAQEPVNDTDGNHSEAPGQEEEQPDEDEADESNGEYEDSEEAEDSEKEEPEEEDSCLPPGESAPEEEEETESHDEEHDDDSPIDEDEETGSINCSVAFSVSSIDEKNIKYRLISSVPYKYWIEDVFGNVIKNPLISSTTSVKSFTTTAYPMFVIVYHAEPKECEEQYQFIRLPGFEQEISNSSCIISIGSSQKATLSAKFFLDSKSYSIDCKLDKKTVFSQQATLDYSGFNYAHEASFTLPEGFSSGTLDCEYKSSSEKFSCQAEFFDASEEEPEKEDSKKQDEELPIIGISSFYTLQKYFLGINRFFINLKGSPESLEKAEDGPVILIFEKIAEISIANLSRLSFNLSQIQPEGRLLAILEQSGSVIDQKHLDYSFELRDEDMFLDGSQASSGGQVSNDTGLITASIAASHQNQEVPPRLDIVLKNKEDNDESSALFSDAGFLMIFSVVIIASAAGLFILSKKLGIFTRQKTEEPASKPQ